jgi:uncharacterized membrane protein
VLQRVDAPRLLRIAEHEDARIHLCAVPGGTVFDEDRVAVVVGGRDVSEQEVPNALGVGSERTFDQDPALALRLLADIALRALSPAINDPTTAVQAVDVITDLLRVLIRRDLGVVVVDGADRTPRVVVMLPTWEDYVSVALDEIIAITPSSGQVRQRLAGLLEGLVAIAPTQHRVAVKQRLVTVTARDP